ncbi:DUF6011 domain-containing protein [Gordonia sp. SCSIO 19800]|uniref:DUF6011 domain-containing protein n=1 Tax=Gordonia sp. SCSIO 19800 TaxID=2826926 RepID=UPI0035AB8696
MTQTKRNPAGANGGARKSTWAADHDKHSPDLRITSPTADEIYERAVVQAATDLGFTVSIPCRVCGHPLTAPKSVAAVVGPKCRRKAVRP